MTTTDRAGVGPPATAGAPVAVVGLGQMGSGMASSLVRAGHAVLGVDPGPAGTPEGVDRTELAAALAQSEVIVLSLPGGEQVDQVVDQVSALRSPRLVLDTSTCDPAGTRRRAEILSRAGHALADAPVSGGPAGALAGGLTVFLGCAEEHLPRVQEALAPLAGRITHVGDVGAGHTAKLVNNLLCGIHLGAARTLLEVSEHSGIDPERLLEAVNAASGRSAVTEVNLPRWVLSGAFDSGFPVGLMARDVELAAAVAAELGASSPVVEAARDMWVRLRDEVGPQEDFNRMVRQ